MIKKLYISNFPLLLLGVFLIFSSSCQKDNINNAPPPSTVTDIDGNVYHTVTIGTQVWMVENLKTTKYRNGEPIINATIDSIWDYIYISGAYCWYNNDAATYKNTYGALYNWWAVSDSRNIAPTGWHIPTEAEWTILSTYLGGQQLSGGKLKEKDTLHWESPNTGATNSSGFTALPGGHRDGGNGCFEFNGNMGFWWSSTWFNNFNAKAVEIYNASTNFPCHPSYICDGKSVRCVKD